MLQQDNSNFERVKHLAEVRLENKEQKIIWQTILEQGQTVHKIMI